MKSNDSESRPLERVRPTNHATTKIRHLALAWLLVLAVAALWLAAQAPSASEPALQPAVENLLPPREQAPITLRVVTFNVHYARDVPALAESLRASPALRDADLFLLQEIEAHPKEGSSRTRRLAEAMQLNYVYAPARHTREGGTHGLAILSRFPLSDIEVLELPRFDLGAKTRRRIALGATVDIAGRLLRLYNIHLDTRINIADRLTQLQPVMDAAAQHEVKEVILGGDFNTNPFRWAWGRVPVFASKQAGTLDEFMKKNGYAVPVAASGSTTRRKLWRVRLDSLYTRGLEPQRFDVDRSVESSDHFPVWLEVRWPPAATNPP